MDIQEGPQYFVNSVQVEGMSSWTRRAFWPS